MIVKIPPTTGFDASFSSMANSGTETRDGAKRVVKMASTPKPPHVGATDDDDDDSVCRKAVKASISEGVRLFPNTGKSWETNSEKYARKQWFTRKYKEIVNQVAADKAEKVCREILLPNFHFEVFIFFDRI